MRLDKFIANNSDYSRRDVKRLLRAGAVWVEGAMVKDPAHNVADEQKVVVDGEVVEQLGPGYYMLNKPLGVVCANSDATYETVFDCLDGMAVEKLHVAGRLDIDTSGLVLITGDGQWSHRVTSPRHVCEKSYLVSLAEPIGERAIEKLQTGVFLHDEKARTAPAVVEVLATDEIRIIITEGRYHQVKRMLAAVGNAVTALHRERIGAIVLDPDLPPGEFRKLTAEEIASV